MTANRLASIVLAGLVLALAGCGGDARPRSTIALAECRLPKLPLAAQCGTLDVPENRDQPDGRRISLAVAVLPANTLHPRADPLFILAGGPGQAASFLGPFAAALTGVRKDRDIVLVDQRGTGRSSPLVCAAFKPDRDLRTMLDFDPGPKAAACARELAAQGIDAAQYTTAAWVADLDAVRAALGYARVNLWGGSYGTRVAQEYLRRHPDRVRSVVLDGVATPAMRTTLDVWPSREIALNAVFDACARSPSCAAAHPDPDARLDAIRDRLGPQGRDVALTDPRTGEALTLHLTFDQVLGALQPFTYAPELAALLPEVIGRAAADDFGPLLRRRDARDRRSRRAVEYRAALLGHLRGGHSAGVAGRRREHAGGSAHEGAGRACARGLRELAAGFESRRRDHTGRERCAGADPLGRSRSGHAARERHGSRENAAGEPPHRGARLRAHRVAARVRAAADRRVHRRSDLRHASRNLRRPLREELPAAALARPARRALVITVDTLAKAFGGRGGVRAVDGVSFTAADGEITGLLGPNGAGKTTLLRMLATLMIPDAGSARIEGHDVVRDRYAVRRRIGVLSDARGLYPRLTARENIRYYGALHGLSGAALDARIDELVGALGIAGIADRRAQGFSQGERMKVAIARALVHDPQTILLDEPTNGLDIMSIRALRDLLRGLRAEGKCLLFSTHVMQEVSALCDSIVILGRGRVVATGTAVELLAQSGQGSLEEAFVRLLGSGEGLAA